MQENKTTNQLIKGILKSFQATAHQTLQGPTTAVARSSHLSSATMSYLDCSPDRSVDSDPRTSTDCGGVRSLLSKTENLRQVLGQKPFLLLVDQAPGALTETDLEGHRISCFDIEGEKRLCLPQIINCILSDFSLSQINAAYDELRIFTSLCSGGQLDVLKRLKVLPPNAVSCGLITKSNAERLCSYLLRRTTAPLARDIPTVAEDGFGVGHKCFGRGRGFFVRRRYLSASSPAIRCCDCFGMFTPSEFVCHSHHALENRVCHWGFDSSRWRNYLLLSKNQPITESLKKEFEDVKALYVDDDKSVFALKRSQSFIANEVKNESSAGETEDRSEQFISASKAAVNDRSAVVSRSLTLNSTSGRFPAVHHSEDVIFNTPDKSFAPNVSLLPDNFYEKRQQELDCENESRQTKCLKMEMNSGETIVSPELFCNPEDYIKAETGCLSKEIESELSQLQKKELSLFRDVLEQTESLSLEERKKVFDNYVVIQKRFQATVDRLKYRQKKLLQELFCIQRKVSDLSDEFSTMHETHRTLMSRLRCEFDASMKSSNDENHQFKIEIETLTNARKRSDFGLMKAKYKAQVELFRRRFQTVESANKELLSKCIELKKLLPPQCHHHLPPTAAAAAKCHSTSSFT